MTASSAQGPMSKMSERSKQDINFQDLESKLAVKNKYLWYSVSEEQKATWIEIVRRLNILSDHRFFFTILYVMYINDGFCFDFYVEK